MRDKIYAYLPSQKAAAPSSELVEQVLKIKGASPNICEKLIQTAVAGDRRFAVDERRFRKIIEKGGTPLSHAEFVFLSLLTAETLQKSRIIVEISAQKARGDKTEERFHILINPGSSAMKTIRLPAEFIHEIEDGITLEKAVSSLFDFSGDAVFVGYDIHSLMNQLNVVLNTPNRTVENPALCLKHLARKLIPAGVYKMKDKKDNVGGVSADTAIPAKIESTS